MTLPELAELAVEFHVREKKIPAVPEGLPASFLTRRAGVFVTIEREKELRGCIGTYLATRKNVAQEVVHNAVAAATEDPRFPVVSKEELPRLSYAVYVLGKPELVTGLDELNPARYGIIVKSVENPAKTGLLLPDLDGVDSPQKQIAIACQKAGINPPEEAIVLYRFKAEKYQ